MTISYVIHERQKLVEVTLEGDVTDEELIDHCKAIGEDSAIEADYVELDRVNSTLELVSLDTVRTIATMLEESVPLRKLAIHTTHDIAFGLSRMYEMLAKHLVIEIQVFRDLKDAKAWLKAR